MKIKLRLSRLTMYLISFLFVSIAGTAAATVIYDSGLPNNAQWRNSDYSNVHGGQAADDFILASDASVTEIHWFGSYLFTPSQPMPDDFTINIYSDETNMPAVDPFHTATFTSSLTRSFTGDVVVTDWGSFNMYEYTVDISPLSLLADTRYWLSIVNNTYDPAGYGGWAWAYNQDGNSTHRWQREGGAWQTFGSSNLAFSLSDSQSVPVPGTLSLLVLGLIGFVFAQYKRNIQNLKPIKSIALQTVLISGDQIDFKRES